MIPLADTPPASDLGGATATLFAGAAATRDGRVVFVPSNAAVVGFARAHCVRIAPEDGRLGSDCPAAGLLPVGSACAPTCDEGFSPVGQFSCAANATSSAECESPCETCARKSRALGFVARDPPGMFTTQGLRAWFANADLEGAPSARWVSRAGGFVGAPTHPNVNAAEPAPAPLGSWGVQTVEGHGARRPVAAVHGTADTGYAFGVREHVMPAGEWSLCAVTRYDATDAGRRVLTGSADFAWGHDGGHTGTFDFGYRGVAIVAGVSLTHAGSDPLSPASFSKTGGAADKDDWVVTCGTNGAFRQSVFANGARVSSSWYASTGSGASFGLGINHFVAGQAKVETSAFAVAEVIVWDRALSDEELLDASEYLRREVLGVAPAPAPPFADRAHAWFASADIDNAETWTSRVGGFTATVAGTAAGSVEALSGFGAQKPVAAIHGSSATNVYFGPNGDGERIVPAGEWSMCTVTRYTGAAKARIIAGNPNFLWGHWGARPGVANCETLFYTRNDKPAGIVRGDNHWLVLCGTNGPRRRSVFANGLSVGNANVYATHSTTKCNDMDFGINAFPGRTSATTEKSDFAVAEVLVWKGALDDGELRAAGAYLREATLGIEDPPPFLDDMHAWFASDDLRSAQSVAGWKSRVGDFTADVTRGSAEVRRLAGAGAGPLKKVTAVHGTTATSVRFIPNVAGQHKVLPEGTFSLCTVARYDGASQNQIIHNIVGTVWGHAGGGAGGTSGYGHLSFLALCNGGWRYNTANQALDSRIASTKKDWVVHCGTNGALRSSFYANGVKVPSLSATTIGAECAATGGQTISANAFSAALSDSHFAVAEIMTWNRALTDDELRRASNYLRRTVLGHAVSEKE